MSNDKPSKTQKKREMLALQDLGERLITLSEHQLEKITLPEDLAQAVHEARNMTKRGALYRQKQYIGKVMRQLDCTPIKDALAKLDRVKRQQIALFKQAETWRDRILSGTPEDIEAFVNSYPDADRQQIRAWRRQYDRERSAAKTPRSSKLLFRYIHELLQTLLETGTA
ncbi:MAG: ribosome biogenesis factor YjgA [Pseudomonadota bacterium]